MTFERQKAFRERIRAAAERQEFEKFMIATPSCSTTTEDEKYAMFLYQREIAMYEERIRKWAASEKQQNSVMLTNLRTVGDEFTLPKSGRLKNKKIRLRKRSETVRKKYKQNKICVRHKRSVESQLRDLSLNVIVVKFPEKKKVSTQQFKNIRQDVPQKLKCKRDVRGAPKNGESLPKERLPDDDVIQFQVCHNS